MKSCEVKCQIEIGNRSIISDKKYVFQFLPESLVDLSQEKTFTYQEKILKTGYVIDIIHNLLLKFYFKKINRFQLSALILKEKYGQLYNYYMKYLSEKGFIVMEKNYLKGSNARIYSLNQDLFGEDILRFKNYDKVVLKKYKNKHQIYEIDNNNIINSDVKKKMISDLYSVDVQYDKAIFYLDSLKDKGDSYNRNKYSTESINDKHIFYHFDQYGRMHTNFTILKSFIRKNCLLIDGEETCEIDIKNSQPFFLSILILISNTNWVNKNEYDLFSNLVFNGNYYQYLETNLGLSDKNEAKELTYKVLFGRNRKNSKYDQDFIKIFPTIHHFIKLYKKEYGDHRVLAHHLQKAESNVIFNRIIKRINDLDPNIKIITIHDSLIIQKKWRNVVTNIFDEEINLIKLNGI